MQRACTILSAVACMALKCFSTLCYKWHDFQKKDTEHKLCVLSLSKNLSRKTSHSMENERDMIKNVYCPSCKIPVIFAQI